MKPWLALASLVMFLAVLLGAFGAHGLKSVLTNEMKSVYQTAVLYHLVHGIAIFIVALVSAHRAVAAIHYAGWFFLIGIILFSGSLYALSITGLTRLGIITPFGGLAFLAGWAALFIGALR